MQQHYQVRSVLASINSEALTLEPVVYYRESETETFELGGETFPDQEECEPSEADAPAELLGGKMTEVRVEGPSGFTPGDLVTLTLEPTLTNYG